MKTDTMLIRCEVETVVLLGGKGSSEAGQEEDEEAERQGAQSGAYHRDDGDEKASDTIGEGEGDVHGMRRQDKRG